MHALKPLGVVAAVVAALAAQAAADGASAPLGRASPARSSANSATFQDSQGEDPQGPDITTVVASNNDAGLITFDVSIPNRPSLTEDMIIGVNVDADNNRATGDPETDGADYGIELFMGQVNLFRWDGSNFSRRAGDPPQVSLIFSYSRGVKITISAAELGDTKRFNFGAIAISGIAVNRQTGDLDFTNARADFAPDLGHGLWNFEVKTAPLRLVAKSFRAARAVAGRPYTVRLVAARSDTGAVLTSGQVRCAATISGRRLAARTHRFVSGAAVCGWQLPSSARGQTIRGSITVVFEGLTVRRSFATRVG